MKYHIKIRSEFVGHYTIEADNINDAEKIARDRCRDELIGNGLDLHFSYSHIHDEKTITELFDND